MPSLKCPAVFHVRMRPQGQEICKVEPSREALVSIAYFYPNVEGHINQIQTLTDFLHGHEYISMEEAKEALSSSNWYKEFYDTIIKQAKNEMWERDHLRPEAFRFALMDVATRHFSPEMYGRGTNA